MSVRRHPPDHGRSPAPGGDRLLVGLPVYDGEHVSHNVSWWDVLLLDLRHGETTTLLDDLNNIRPWYAWDEWDGSSGSSYPGDGPWPGAAWSSEGSHVAIHAEGFDGEVLAIVRVVDSSAVEVPIGYLAPASIVWSSDGSRLAYLDDDQLVRLSADGTDSSMRALPVARGRGNVHPALAPAPDGDGFLVTLDGRVSAPATSGVLIERYPASSDAAPTQWANLEYPGDPVMQRLEACVEWET